MKQAFLFSAFLLLAACQKEAPQTPAADTTAYPLDHCLVSGEKLGGMGEPVSIVHDGREVKFCCDQCIPKFRKDPEKYLSKLDSETK
ncbi:MAG: YHS domain-containing protein [Verrucomicrobiae bacterium]|nr:YHS domain-containing protein [Verrucomicrobiae bacterium]